MYVIRRKVVSMRGMGVEGWDRRRSEEAGRRGGSFEIWAGTGATMGKGSAGVLEK
jgi:hypothetical protein